MISINQPELEELAKHTRAVEWLLEYHRATAEAVIAIQNLVQYNPEAFGAKCGGNKLELALLQLQKHVVKYNRTH